MSVEEDADGQGHGRSAQGDDHVGERIACGDTNQRDVEVLQAQEVGALHARADPRGEGDEREGASPIPEAIRTYLSLSVSAADVRVAITRHHDDQHERGEDDGEERRHGHAEKHSDIGDQVAEQSLQRTDSSRPLRRADIAIVYAL